MAELSPRATEVPRVILAPLGYLEETAKMASPEHPAHQEHPAYVSLVLLQKGTSLLSTSPMMSSLVEEVDKWVSCLVLQDPPDLLVHLVKLVNQVLMVTKDLLVSPDKLALQVPLDHLDMQAPLDNLERMVKVEDLEDLVSVDYLVQREQEVLLAWLVSLE